MDISRIIEYDRSRGKIQKSNGTQQEWRVEDKHYIILDERWNEIAGERRGVSSELKHREQQICD